jgi:hypothetical protein
VTSPGTVTFADIKSSRTALRLWHDGQRGSEYFLVENRQRTGYDGLLPGGGLLVRLPGWPSGGRGGIRARRVPGQLL